MTGDATVTSDRRVLAVAWLIVALLSTVPYARAYLWPPKDSAFTGFFFFKQDMFNYLSYVQQAEDGAFLFRNKLNPTPHAPALLNLEWWTVGRISALLGRRPDVAYHLVGLLALLALMATILRWLRRGGLPDSHRLPALLLVCTGAGLGGLRFRLLGPPAWRSLDLTTGLYPVIEILVNPHFVLGTALSAATLLALLQARRWRGDLLAVLLGTILGLVRPYDLVLLSAVRLGAVLATEPVRAWVRKLLPLAGFLPVAAYNYWIFYRNPAFRVLSQFDYTFPPLGDFVTALGPAVVLALLWWRRRPVDESARRAGHHLVAWALLGLLLIVIRPVSFTLQFLAGIGLPFLALGALALGAYRRVLTLMAAAAFATTGLIALGLLLEDNPRWFVPAEELAAARALRATCRPGSVLLSPPEIGLYAIGLSPCAAFVSHGIMGSFDERSATVESFYLTMKPDERSDLLDRACATHLVLPGDAGDRPVGWLGGATPFWRAALVGHPPALISVYERRGPDPCPRR